MRLETKAVHSGVAPDPTTKARQLPVYRTSSYVFDSAEHARNLFALKELGNIYTRLMNPTTDALEKKVADLEGGAAALALASGTNAIFYSIINIAQAGDEIVSANNLYGGTFTQFNDILPQFGIKVNFVNPNQPENFDKAITPKTKAVFVESTSNPGLDVTDLEAVANIAHKHGIPLIVDSTFSTPFLTRPIEFGADIVVHSLTKWMGGHGAAIGGIVVDSGKFNWQSEKFPLMTQPDQSYHGIRWAYDLGPLSSIAYILRMRVIPLRNLGGCIAPDNAWLFTVSLESLHLRIERHASNSLAVAKYLLTNEYVEWVRYPGLQTDPHYKLALKYLSGKGGPMVVFGIKGGRAAGEKFVESLKLFSHLANVGDAKSLAIHPASTTHSQLSEAALEAGGVKPELIRLSVGIEHIDDIVEDLEQALKRSQQ